MVIECGDPGTCQALAETLRGVVSIAVVITAFVVAIAAAAWKWLSRYSLVSH